MKKFSIIVAETKNHGIGYQGTIPWDIPSDRQFFRKKTLHHTLLVGRVTFDSLPANRLPNRQLIVVSRQLPFPEALAQAYAQCNGGKVFVIGGAQLYNEAIQHPDCETVYVSYILENYQCDVFWNGVDERHFELVKQDGMYFKYKRRLHPEKQYLNIAHRIMAIGGERTDRTGVGTLSVFGERMEFQLDIDAFPLLTTKRVFWRGVVEEMLWFLRGSTSAKELSERGVHIWDGYGVDQLGPIYGNQWKRQLPTILEQLKSNPHSRRHIVSAWNVSELDQMILPPCHMMYQFFVDEKNNLSCQMYQRSADWAVGVPFNIASYALLTLMVAQVTGYQPGKLIMVFGDAHVYKNHLEPLQTQLQRNPYPFPKIRLNSQVTDLFAFTADDIQLEQYTSHPRIAMEFNV